MPASTDRTALTSARAVLDSRRRTLIAALLEAEEASQALTAARRRHSSSHPDRVAAQNRKNAADTALASARVEERNARNALNDTLGTWINGVTVDDDFGRLDAAVPIVLFPVRLETRFDGTAMKLRIYPDEIFLNKHEKALTREEHEAAIKYYKDLNEFGDEPSRWREIVARFGAERSAYLLRIMLPTFGDPGGTSGTSSFTSGTCGGTITGGLNEALTFPTDIQFRSASWTRPGEAVLPDRWMVILIRDGVPRAPIVLPRIPEPLPFTLDPNLPESQLQQISRNADYKIDDDIRWTVDFDRAVSIGMACQVPLSAAEAAPLTGGFDRIIVLGVKSSMDPGTTSIHMEDLLDAHHYTRGLAIVRQGTPTNNTKDSPTPFPPADEAGARSFEIERRRAPLHRTRAHHCLLPDTDGYALTRMLGVPSGVAANIDRGYEHEIARSYAMNRATWPATYDYFLRYLMAPLIAPADVDKARSYFSNYVSARGPAPAFRVGAVPYGVLPITSLGRWQERPLGSVDERTVEAAILGPTKQLISTWFDKVNQVPQVRPNSTTPDVDLVRVLATLPSAKEVRIRTAFETLVYYNIFVIHGWYYGEAHENVERLNEELFGRLAHPEWRPRLGTLVFDEQAFWFGLPMVNLLPLSETAPLTQDYVNGLWSATLAQTMSGAVPILPFFPNFGYLLLRHAALLEYARIAGQLAPTTVWTEPPFWIFPSQPTQLTIGQIFQQVGEAARDNATEFRSALLRLIGIPSAELDRLVSESLDLASRRVDAWAAGFANRRIQKMRDAQQTTQLAPVGDYLGGYGWVENVRPRVRQLTTVDGITAEIQVGTGGYIHAPSVTHASAAAVLRSANLSARIEDPGKYAIDLSSERVRDARRVMDEVRNRQPLGAVLGYRFERILHDAALDNFRFELRALYPLVAGKNGVDTGEPAERIAARNVVDGLRLLRASREGDIPFNTNPRLPTIGSTAHGVIMAAIAHLESQLDATADLLTAEGVFQLVRGNVTGAPPSLENLVAGRAPPDPAVARTPRGGNTISHRVAFVISEDAPPAPSPHWPNTTARAKAEPVLDAWLGELIGDPDNVTCRVTFAEDPFSVTVKLTDLQIAPLDLLAISRDVTDKPKGSPLEERILTAALGDDTSKTEIAVDYERPAGATDLTLNRTFPEALEMARALAAVLDQARQLEPADLLPPAERDAGTEEGESSALAAANELASRAAIAVAAIGDVANGTTAHPTDGPSLEMALTGVDPVALRAALRRAAAFVPERAFPPRIAAGAELVTIALAVQAELRRRIKAVPTETGGDAKAITTRAQATFRAVFGPGFLGLLDVAPPRGDELSEALADRAALIGSDESAPDRYLAQVMRVQAPLGRWRRLTLYARALGAPKPRLDVVQLPHVPGEKWLGLSLPEEQLPEDPRAALLLLSNADELDPSVTWRGLMIDQWTEVIPRKEEDTGIALHYDSPRAAAPQAVLVAAPATNLATWPFADLLAAIEETMDLAKVRAVDTELLDIAQLVPVTLIATNPLAEVTVPADIDDDNIFSAAIGAAEDLF
jgi:hypothetical protein